MGLKSNALVRLSRRTSLGVGNARLRSAWFMALLLQGISLPSLRRSRRVCFAPAEFRGTIFSAALVPEARTLRGLLFPVVAAVECASVTAKGSNAVRCGKDGGNGQGGRSQGNPKGNAGAAGRSSAHCVRPYRAAILKRHRLVGAQKCTLRTTGGRLQQYRGPNSGHPGAFRRQRVFYCRLGGRNC